MDTRKQCDNRISTVCVQSIGLEEGWHYRIAIESRSNEALGVFAVALVYHSSTWPPVGGLKLLRYVRGQRSEVRVVGPSSLSFQERGTFTS